MTEAISEIPKEAYQIPLLSSINVGINISISDIANVAGRVSQVVIHAGGGHGSLDTERDA